MGLVAPKLHVLRIQGTKHYDSIPKFPVAFYLNYQELGAKTYIFKHHYHQTNCIWHGKYLTHTEVYVS